MGICSVFALTWTYANHGDEVFWPGSAMQRIEKNAAILRETLEPARWCYPSRHNSNLLSVDMHADGYLRDCLARIEPAGDFIERYPKEYMLRIYRAKTEGYFCEVTLSTTFNDHRTIGSDCYYGLSRNQDDMGVGMTDDPFG